MCLILLAWVPAAYCRAPPRKSQVDCFLQAELCQHPRWKDAAPKPTGTHSEGNGEGKGDGPSFSGGGGGGKGAPRLFVVREGEVFPYGGEPPLKAFDMVEFAKELAGIGGEEVSEAADDDKEVGCMRRRFLWFLTIFYKASAVQSTSDSPPPLFLAPSSWCWWWTIGRCPCSRKSVFEGAGARNFSTKTSAVLRAPTL